MHIPVNQYDLLEHGPVVEAEIFPDEAAFLKNKNFGTRENFVKVRLLIDTGSNISGLDIQHIQNGCRGMEANGESYAMAASSICRYLKRKH
jgi:hypothetical protein